MSEPAISVRGLSKCYHLGGINRRTLVDEFAYWWHTFRGRDPRDHIGKIDLSAREARKAGIQKKGVQPFWALQDVSFDIQPGEVVGIIGANGAGKSTLLKILTRITEPTSGEAFINGRIGSLLEVGTGFHPELTGRENIFMNGTILGMKKAEIQAKFEEIVDFAEVDEFLDTPVKRYSSGMKVRLAFAVAAHLDPEIMIIDEVLAVGDDRFQKKCLGKMSNVVQSGRSILFVSHQMPAIQSLCGRAILMEHGRVKMEGTAEEVVTFYLGENATAGASSFRRRPDTPWSGTGEAQCVRADLYSLDGRPTTSFKMGEGFVLRMGVRATATIRDLAPMVGLFDQAETFLGRISSADCSNQSFQVAADQEIEITCTVKSMNLLPGPHSLSLILKRRGSNEMIDRVLSALRIEILPADVFGTGHVPLSGGLIFLESEWQ